MQEINKYTSFFHDGSINNIEHFGNTMLISMESAELDEKDFKGEIVLSKDNRIKGQLHIEGIQNILVNNHPFLGCFKMKKEDAEIFHFKLGKCKVKLQIIWSSPALNIEEDFSTLEIKAQKISWENLPE